LDDYWSTVSTKRMLAGWMVCWLAGWLLVGWLLAGCWLAGWLLAD
jgi:hypothetical protein